MARRNLPLAPLERIMRQAGAARVSADAVRALQECVDDVARSLADEALRASRHARRRTITRDDVKLAASR